MFCDRDLDIGESEKGSPQVCKDSGRFPEAPFSGRLSGGRFYFLVLHDKQETMIIRFTYIINSDAKAQH